MREDDMRNTSLQVVFLVKNLPPKLFVILRGTVDVIVIFLGHTIIDEVIECSPGSIAHGF
jgi:hypothetical protein